MRALAGETIDAESVVLGALLPGSISDRVAEAYDEHLFHGKTLQDLPDEPRFVINATNVQSGALWRFTKPYMGDYRVGKVEKPDVPLAQAVAASSAFPPVLSPLRWARADSDSRRTRARPARPAVHHARSCSPTAASTTTSAWRPPGSATRPFWSATPAGSCRRRRSRRRLGAASYRVLNLIDNQVRSLRKRQVIDSFKARAKHARAPIGASAPTSPTMGWRMRCLPAEARCSSRDADAAEAPR